MSFACRSIHLSFDGPPGLAFLNEIVPVASAPGTYFCVCGFSDGYFGIQKLTDGSKVVIFSVWDPGVQNDPETVPEERQVKILYKDDLVHVGRFGNEGTGTQSFYKCNWSAGKSYRFLVIAEDLGERTAYTAYFAEPADYSWRRLVTYSTLSEEKFLSGYYSFVEDFDRSPESSTNVRAATFQNVWVKKKDGNWTALRRCMLTSDESKLTNFDAGVLDDKFFLMTGGETRNSHAKIGETLILPGQNQTLPELPEE